MFLTKKIFKTPQDREPKIVGISEHFPLGTGKTDFSNFHDNDNLAAAASLEFESLEVIFGM